MFGVVVQINVFQLSVIYKSYRQVLTPSTIEQYILDTYAGKQQS